MRNARVARTYMPFSRVHPTRTIPRRDTLMRVERTVHAFAITPAVRCKALRHGRHDYAKFNSARRIEHYIAAFGIFEKLHYVDEVLHALVEQIRV